MTEGRKRNQHEFKLACKVADYLRSMALPGVFWSHWPNGEDRPVSAGARLQRMGTVPGVADYILVRERVPYALELKLASDPIYGTRKTYQSPEQKVFQADWEAAGGVYACVHGYDEAIAFLAEHELVRPDRNRAAA